MQPWGGRSLLPPLMRPVLAPMRAGLWEVPVWRLDNKTAGAKPYAMDYGYSYETEAM